MIEAVKKVTHIFQSKKRAKAAQAGASGEAPPSAPVELQPLSADDSKVRIVVDAPASMAAGKTVSVSCEVTNLGRSPFSTAGKWPIHLSYKWFDGAAQLPLEGERTGFETPLPPGKSRRVQASVRTPESPGSFELLVTLVQEEIAWFDTLDPANTGRATVKVTA